MQTKHYALGATSHKLLGSDDYFEPRTNSLKEREKKNKKQKKCQNKWRCKETCRDIALKIDRDNKEELKCGFVGGRENASKKS